MAPILWFIWSFRIRMVVKSSLAFVGSETQTLQDKRLQRADASYTTQRVELGCQYGLGAQKTMYGIVFGTGFPRRIINIKA